MSCLYIFIVSLVAATSANPVTETYKDQFCTDPRTMQKHAAYTEWADAYSCTRHRCQPGGRNLAIYTVGCKRVEAPESAIECEEVVEDTNMQFPFCCTRLRCLVVVRGEVWTRVLGQPWEALPAAPWSHMYKMKKPPPTNGALLPKNVGSGPIYELAVDSESDGQKVLRAGKKTTETPDCNDAKPIQVPDIVIALATEPELKQQKKIDSRHKRRKTSQSTSVDEASDKEPHNEMEFEDAVIVTERAPDASEEKSNLISVTRKSSKTHQAAWTEIPLKEWNEQEPVAEQDNTLRESSAHLSETSEDEKKPALQALVDAIGTRMRDIENVVQKMSEKVHQVKPGESDSSEKRMTDHLSDAEVAPPRTHHKSLSLDHGKDLVMRPKQPAQDAEHYKRFTVRSRGSKYLRTTDGPSEPPLFVEDSHLNGYFSDASNSVQRRASPPKEPAQYVAPVDTRRKTHVLSDSDETRKRKYSHKKKGKGHKKHHGKDKRKKLQVRMNSAELDRNVVSLEENSAIVSV